MAYACTHFAKYVLAGMMFVRADSFVVRLPFSPGVSKSFSALLSNSCRDGIAIAALPARVVAKPHGSIRNRYLHGSRVTLTAVAKGDVATIDYNLRRENGEPFDTPFDQGRVRIVAGQREYAPFVHKAVLDMSEGERREVTIPPRDAFGEYNEDMTAKLGIESAPEGMEPGMMLRLWTGQKAKVKEVTEKDFTIDWNPEGAGTSLVMDVEVLDAKPARDVLKKATFAGGCFWGLQLAMQRVEGVVSTKVGYAQGSVKQPSYSDVCSGKTGHTEAVQVMYDPEVTTYNELLKLFFERHDPTQAGGQGNDKGTQYRAGAYVHDDEQRETAEAFFAEECKRRGCKKLATELEDVKEFWDAEEEHQMYLQKGGQDARKKATETIRCYG